MVILIGIATALAAYLIGSINTSIILSTRLTGEDIRNTGSGNAGTTNMLRTHGKKLAIITLLGDVLKGVIAVLLALLVDYFASFIGTMSHVDSHILGSLPYIAGFFAVVGHNYPIFFGFKGGKGVLTSFSVILILDWKIALLLLLCEAVVIAIWKMVSLGSCLAAVLFMVLSLVLRRSDVYFVVLSFVLSIILIYRHRTNISRIIKGEESKLKF